MAGVVVVSPCHKVHGEGCPMFGVVWILQSFRRYSDKTKFFVQCSIPFVPCLQVTIRLMNIGQITNATQHVRTMAVTLQCGIGCKNMNVPMRFRWTKLSVPSRLVLNNGIGFGRKGFLIVLVEFGGEEFWDASFGFGQFDDEGDFVKLLEGGKDSKASGGVVVVVVLGHYHGGGHGAIGSPFPEEHVLLAT